MDNKKELNEQLAKLVQNIYDALSEAEIFAKEHKLKFHFSPAYGMGGSFVPFDEDIADDLGGEIDEYGWIPSSYGC